MFIQISFKFVKTLNYLYTVINEIRKIKRNLFILSIIGYKVYVNVKRPLI